MTSTNKNWDRVKQNPGTISQTFQYGEAPFPVLQKMQPTYYLNLEKMLLQ